jgi:hypothetical protein
LLIEHAGGRMALIAGQYEKYGKRMKPEVVTLRPGRMDRKYFLGMVPVILAALLLSGQAQGGVGTKVYTRSAHGSSTSGVDRSSFDERFRSGEAYLQYSKGNCAHCHEQHASISGVSSGGKPVLVFNDDTSSSLPDARTLCSDCHDGTPVSPDVTRQLEKRYAHPTYQEFNKHTMSKLEMRENGAPFFPEPLGERRHAECVDCHEPHTLSFWNDAIPNPFTLRTHTYRSGSPTASQDNNLVSGVLRGTWGVRHTNEPLWEGMNGVTFEAFTEVESRYSPVVGDPVPMREYNICYKCHSYYALREPDGVLSRTGPSGQLITDQAMEFSKNNRSAHPVREGLLYQDASPAKGLAPASGGFGGQCISPWTNYGEQTMYCSDCHGADDEALGGAKGPHGSDRPFMLKGQRQFWPESSSTSGGGAMLFSLNDLANQDMGGDYNGPSIANAELFCLNCHDIYNSGTWTHLAHGAHANKNYRPDNVSGPGATHNLYCVACHAAVPHGVRRSRLMAYRDDPVPYRFEKNFGGTTYNMVVIQGFKVEADRRNYAKANCWSSISGCHNRESSVAYEDR